MSSKAKSFFIDKAQNLLVAIKRFSLSLVFFMLSAGVFAYQIQRDKNITADITRLLFVFYLSGIFALCVQLFFERFPNVLRRKIYTHIIGIAFAVGLFLLLLLVKDFTSPVNLRLSLFALILVCFVFVIPSIKKGCNFNYIAFSYFKAFFVSLLFSLVVWGGFSIILFAIDVLLYKFKPHIHIYVHNANFVWNILAPLFFFSYIPVFNKDTDEKQITPIQKSRVFEVLISYIFIPLIYIYLFVMYVYLVKILIQFSWPSGYLGPLVLWLSTSSIIVYILSKTVDNAFARAFQKTLMILLIPLVLVQLISIGIRLNAYGVTVSRYYLLLFALFTLITSVGIVAKIIKNDNIIAVLVAFFVAVSLLPPIDAHEVSKRSQLKRLDYYLTKENMLQNNTIIPKTDINDESKKEIQEIVRYLQSQKYLSEVSYLPAFFDPYSDMKQVFGFPLYDYTEADDYFSKEHVNVEKPKLFSVADYDFAIPYEYKFLNKSERHELTKGDNHYTLEFEKKSDRDTIVSIKDKRGKPLLTTNLGDVFDEDIALSRSDKDNYLRMFLKGNGCELEILFSRIYHGGYKSEPLSINYILECILLIRFE